MRCKKLLTAIFSAVFILSLVLVPALPNPSPAHAFNPIGWTKEGSNPVFTRDTFTGASTVIYDTSDSTYKMWYTHGEYDATTIDSFFDDILDLDLEWLIEDILDGDFWWIAHDDGEDIELVMDFLAGLSYEEVEDLIYSTAAGIGYATSADGITWTDHNYVLAPGDPGEWDDHIVGAPSVFKDGSTYKMWYTGMTIDITAIMNLLDDLEELPPDGIEILLTDISDKRFDYFVEDLRDGMGDDYVLALIMDIVDILQSIDVSIGYATSPDGTTWTKYASNPVLTKGTSTDWDKYGVATPSVIKDGTGYKAWFTGFGIDYNQLLGLLTAENMDDLDAVFQASTTIAIGYATSTDGMTWTKQPGNPVITNGASGAWDSHAVFAPSVVKDISGNYEIWYTGVKVLPRTFVSFLYDNSFNDALMDGMEVAIGHAISADGINWSKDGLNPVLSRGTDDAWDKYGVAFPSVVRVGNSKLLFYTGFYSDPKGVIDGLVSGDGCVSSLSDTQVAIGLATFTGITVFYPNGGEIFNIGTTHTIYWTYSNLPDWVRIELFKGGVVNTTIASFASCSNGSGSYTWWSIPMTQAGGNDYQIKITSPYYPGAFDYSDSNFTIVGPTVTVTSPNGGEVWNPGSTHNISWNYNLVSGFVRIDLYKGGIPNTLIILNCPIGAAGSGTYSWTIPVGQALGADYKIKVTSRTNPTVFDSSNNNFAIGGTPTHTVTVNAGANGSITPGTGPVPEGATPTYNIAANVGYHIADVLVDGVSVGAVPSYTFPPVYADHTISATFASNFHTITVTPGAHGTITPGTGLVADGATPTYNITPDPGYHTTDVLVDGLSIGVVPSYTFPAVHANHSISATFLANNHTITVSPGLHGNITPGTGLVADGATPTYNITADAGYHILDVQVDGISVGAVPSYMFPPVHANHLISATFMANNHTITVSAGPNGSINPGTGVVADGSTPSYNITASPGYHISDVLVDSVSVGTPSVYTFPPVHADHTISATFSNTWTITVNAGANGSITPGTGTVLDGATPSYNIAANPGYVILDVLVDGVSVGTPSLYTFPAVHANHTISATFAASDHTITVSPGPNGNITPGTGTVADGATPTYNITASIGYHINDVLVDGSSVGAVPSYTFPAVHADHTISATFAPNTGGTLVVTYPNGGQSFNLGTTNTITWAYSGLSGWVRIELFKGGVFNKTIASYAAIGTGGTGQFNWWVIPTTQAGGNDYQIKITSISSPAVFDFSDTNFSIVGPIITVVSPNGGEVWNPGTTHTISWNYNLISGFVRIDLRKGGVTNYVVTYNTPIGTAGSGTFLWTVPAGQALGSDYKIIVTSLTNSTVLDSSDSNFSIGGVPTYTITVSPGANGTITPGTGVVADGATPTYNITANPGYHIVDVLVDGSSVGAVPSYTFPAVHADHTISATFSNTYTITVTAGPNGTITPGTGQVADGATPTYNITANTGYHVFDVLVDGSSVGAVPSYTFPAVHANHTISATFMADNHTITVSPGANGTITPGTGLVADGSTPTYNITANPGYHISSIMVDGILVPILPTYTFTPVHANHTISATFTADNHTITVTPGANGTITPGTGTVADGATPTYNITANPGYHIADVLVDGGSVGAVPSYTFTPVHANHTISATFSNTWTITVNAGANGSITPGTGLVVDGSTPTYNITANTGYHISSIMVDGVLVPISPTYTFPAVHANHTISATFAPNAGGVITVVWPNGNESLNAGTNNTIYWTYAGLTGWVRIELFKGGVFNTTIASYASIGTGGNGSFNPWVIPTTQAGGNDYQIKITSMSNPAVFDTSDTNFTIVGPTITVVSPNGSEVWSAGSTHTISWNYSLISGYVKIELLKGGVVNSVISSNCSIGTAGSGTFSWTIPAGQTLGSDYKIRITSLSNSTVTDSSDTNFSIAGAP